MEELFPEEAYDLPPVDAMPEATELTADLYDEAPDMADRYEAFRDALAACCAEEEPSPPSLRVPLAYLPVRSDALFKLAFCPPPLPLAAALGTAPPPLALLEPPKPALVDLVEAMAFLNLARSISSRSALTWAYSSMTDRWTADLRRAIGAVGGGA